jgi:hypothetical protein
VQSHIAGLIKTCFCVADGDDDESCVARQKKTRRQRFLKKFITISPEKL